MTIYTPSGEFMTGDRETRNTPYKSKNSKDRRGYIVRAAPGCPFYSIDTISLCNIMKRE
jgi:hypothetical protein